MRSSNLHGEMRIELGDIVSQIEIILCRFANQFYSQYEAQVFVTICYEFIYIYKGPSKKDVLLGRDMGSWKRLEVITFIVICR